MRKEIEERLVDFSVLVFCLSKQVKKEFFGNYLMNQLVRSSASAALNYGEAQSAETRKDFIHKISVVLKELRESDINLKIINKSRIMEEDDLLIEAQDECNQLISIFYRTVQTAKSRA